MNAFYISLLTMKSSLAFGTVLFAKFYLDKFEELSIEGQNPACKNPEIREAMVILLRGRREDLSVK
jgi:hypothetical protein